MADDEHRSVNVVLSKELGDEFLRIAEQEDRAISKILRRLIKRYVDDYNAS